MPSISGILDMEIAFNVTLAEVIGRKSSLSAQGFRPISLCLHAAPIATCFSVIWVKRPGPPWGTTFLATKDELDADLGPKAGLGFPIRPRLMGAVQEPTDSSTTLYSVVWDREVEPASRVELGLGLEAFRAKIAASFESGIEYIRSLAAHGVPGRHPRETGRYSVVWETQPTSHQVSGRGRHCWSCFVRTADVIDDVVGAIEAGFAYPEQCSPLDDSGTLRYAALFRDDAILGTELVRDVGADDLETLIVEKALTDTEHWPIRLHGTGTGPGQRFSVVFAAHGHHLPEPRKSTVRRKTAAGAPASSDPAALSPFGAYDRYLSTLMKDNSVRTGALDQLLVHLGRFKADGEVGEILNIATEVMPAVGNLLSPGAPKAQQVLDGRAAFNPAWHAWYALTEDESSLLAHKKAPTPGLVIHGTTRPGRLPKPDYSGLGYFFLGRVIWGVGGKEYASWTMDNVFSVDHAPQVDVSTSRADEARNGEAEPRYHARHPSYGTNLWSADPSAIAAYQYDALHMPTRAAQGGWALPMYECAWLFSRLGLYGPSLFSGSSTANAALEVLARDKARVAYIWSDGTYSYLHHNGSLQGTSALAFTRSDGLTIAMALSCDIQGGLQMGVHGAELAARASNTADWPSNDLFPELLP